MDLKELAINEGSRHPWELVRTEVVRHLVNRQFKPGSKLNILDVGSGDTYMIRKLSESLPNASFFAVDTGYSPEFMADQNQEFKKDSLAIRIFNTLENAEQACGEKIDLILLLDVIEHVPDDVKLLQELTRLTAVKSDTVFVITVPAYQSLFGSHDRFLGHFRRYNNRLLEKNVREAGLNSMQLGYFFLVPLLFRMMEILLERSGIKRGDATGIGRWEGKKFSTQVLLAVLRIDFWITKCFRKLAIQLPGLSNFAICKKSA